MVVDVVTVILDGFQDTHKACRPRCTLQDGAQNVCLQVCVKQEPILRIFADVALPWHAQLERRAVVVWHNVALDDVVDALLAQRGAQRPEMLYLQQAMVTQICSAQNSTRH